MPCLFDAYVTVDWSAASLPRTGADSIWVHLVERDDAGVIHQRQVNPSTRHAASAFLADVLSDLVARDRVTLVGCDFAFGYPAGFARRIAGGASGWQGVWQEIERRIEDNEANENNRLDVAAYFNREVCGGAFPFWSCPRGNSDPAISPKKPRNYGPDTLAEFRLTERALRGPKSVWQLYGAGSVGSQTLLGVAHLQRLRRHPWLDGRARIWPFETGLKVPTRPAADDWRVLFAEVYPSMLPLGEPAGEIKDARQVAALAKHFAALDAAGELATLFAGPAGLSAEARATVETEEGWILGAMGPITTASTTPPRYVYIRDPEAIYAASFATIRAEADLASIPAALQPLAIRVIHAAGDPAIASRLVASPEAVAAGHAALAAGAPILVDTAMVAAGIIRRQLPADTRMICTLSEPEVAETARAIGNTRSAAAVELWRPWLDGAIVVIGNAPTALFHLLEIIDAGGPRPALILGFPVGFVGAAESKEALIAHDAGIPFVALRGRRGGSAIAAAAVNALASAPS